MLQRVGELAPQVLEATLLVPAVALVFAGKGFLLRVRVGPVRPVVAFRVDLAVRRQDAAVLVRQVAAELKKLVARVNVGAVVA